MAPMPFRVNLVNWQSIMALISIIFTMLGTTWYLSGQLRAALDQNTAVVHQQDEDRGREAADVAALQLQIDHVIRDNTTALNSLSVHLERVEGRIDQLFTSQHTENIKPPLFSPPTTHRGSQ